MADRTLIHVIDDDEAVRDSLEALLLAEGFAVMGFDSAEAFLIDGAASAAGCCLLDVRMPGMDGLTLLRRLGAAGAMVPVVVMTGHGDVPMAVKAMKLGAVDFIEKPFDAKTMLATIRTALRTSTMPAPATIDPALAEKLGRLTPREREVLEELVAGRSNKEVGRELGISPRTVEIHRARLMEKMAADSLAHLVRLALEAGIEPVPK
ncbi:MAG: response regulator [Rhizobiales bacterium]|nr:response regulator [Hyphomicrobiales bacterium]